MKDPVTVNPLPSKVSDLWIQNSQHWDLQLINDIFDYEAVQAITSTIPVPSQQQDTLRWTQAPKGDYSTKQIYKTLSANNVVQLPSQGSRSIQPQANHILCRVWKSKALPPLIKTFVWRLIQRALATAERASRYSTHIDSHCAACGQLETDFHIFFQCALPTEVWTTFQTPFDVHNLIPENDGIQSTLPIVIPATTNDHTFQKILYTLWYLWKARNDNHFNHKHWTAAQVHHAAQTHLHTFTTALNSQPLPDQNHTHAPDHTTRQHIHSTGAS
jgi:hypothetical protein